MKKQNPAKDFMCQSMDFRDINTPSEWDELSRDNESPYRDSDVISFLDRCLKQVKEENDWQ